MIYNILGSICLVLLVVFSLVFLGAIIASAMQKVELRAWRKRMQEQEDNS